MIYSHCSHLRMNAGDQWTWHMQDADMWRNKIVDLIDHQILYLEKSFFHILSRFHPYILATQTRGKYL